MEIEDYYNKRDFFTNFTKFLKINKGLKIRKIKGIHELNKPQMYIIINNKIQEIWYLRYSKDYRGYIYFFGFEKNYLEKLSKYEGYIIFGCGSIKNIFKIPANWIIEKLRHVSTAIDHNYKIHINEKFGEYKFKVPNGAEINIEKFRYS